MDDKKIEAKKPSKKDVPKYKVKSKAPKYKVTLITKKYVFASLNDSGTRIPYLKSKHKDLKIGDEITI